MNTSLDISNTISDPIIVDLLSETATIAAGLEIPFFVVGAMARDMVLWHGFGIRTTRAKASPLLEGK